MPLIKRQSGYFQRGTSLLEVLITIIILAFGLLGLAGLQAQIQLAEVESFQRAQATLLLADMQNRISVNRQNADSYVTAGTIGTGDGLPADCTGTTPQAARDICEWSNALKGASETMVTGGTTTNTGAMNAARGCIKLVTPANGAACVCTPGVYQIDVVWQGTNPTSTSALTCGQSFYTPTTRRAISSQITVGRAFCTCP